MTVRMRVYHHRHPPAPGWLWACSEINHHGLLPGVYPDWLPPFLTAESAADDARSHWRTWHGPRCERCGSHTVHRSDVPRGAYAYTCDCGQTVMAGRR